MRVCADSMPVLYRYAMHGRVVVFDTETTGMSNQDEICQIAAIEYERGVETRTMNEYLTPTCPMNPFAEQVHGLSHGFLEAHGIPPAVGIDRFFSFLGGDVLLVAHNLPFDMRMLNNVCIQYGLLHARTDIETCDTLALARFARPDLGCYTLENLVGALGTEGMNSHDALDDAHACAGVFFRLVGSAVEGLGGL